LKEEKKGEREEAVILENKDYIGSAEKKNCSACQYQFLGFVFESPRN
jgi:hypothetical protein